MQDELGGLVVDVSPDRMPVCGVCGNADLYKIGILLPFPEDFLRGGPVEAHCQVCDARWDQRYSTLERSPLDAADR